MLESSAIWTREEVSKQYLSLALSSQTRTWKHAMLALAKKGSISSFWEKNSNKKG